MATGRKRIISARVDCTNHSSYREVWANPLLLPVLFDIVKCVDAGRDEVARLIVVEFLAVS